MQSFPVSSGDKVVLPITVTDNDGSAVTLTGASARFAMARDIGKSLVIDSDASPATASISISSNVVTVTIDDADTEALEGDYYYECKVTDSSGNEAVVARGWITFVRNLI